MTIEQQRIINYLTRRYDSLSEKQLNSQLKKTIDRLTASGAWEIEFLEDVLQKLRKKEGWSKPRTVAYLDALDILDRT
mgnify:FL=1|jgi:hypothetical protein|tara:strand:+ start:316 stop:549 length:234 start_codon:yes stop_codon:yes gene_type:complete